MPTTPPKPRRIARPPAFVSHSTELDTDYFVYAETCGDQTLPMPVVVVVDGDYMFEPLVDAAKKLRRENAIPAVLLVGIGYGKSFGDPQNRRGRDYTTSAGGEEPDSGGADPFFKHLTVPLWAELGRRYPLRDDLRVIAGHSLGGLFALHALFQADCFFNAAIVGAPSLWWNGGRYFDQLAQFRKMHGMFQGRARSPSAPRISSDKHGGFGETARPVSDTRLFLGIGENDTESMTGDFARLGRQLSAAPFGRLEVVSRKYAGHDHYNLLPVLFRDGLRNIFE
jgi:pimeloyl-ACP methyl ester carboxylesterase